MPSGKVPSVRPYQVTQDRVQSSRPLDMMVHIVATGTIDPATLNIDHAQVVGACSQPCAIAEIAALMQQPISAIKILVCDLLDVNAVAIDDSTLLAETDIHLLERIRDGLKLQR